MGSVIKLGVDVNARVLSIKVLRLGPYEVIFYGTIFVTPIILSPMYRWATQWTLTNMSSVSANFFSFLIEVSPNKLVLHSNKHLSSGLTGLLKEYINYVGPLRERERGWRLQCTKSPNIHI